MTRHGNAGDLGDPATHNPSGLQRLRGSLIGNARLQDDRRSHDRDEADRRQSERAEVNASASLGTSLRQGIEGQLYNLSARGCSVRLPENLFNLGDSVWFRIEAIQPWRGTVRWVSENSVGVEFEHPFYPSVFEFLVQTNKPVTVSNAA